MSDPATVVRTWIEETWNAGRLERLGDLHPPEFLNEGEPSTPAEADAWHRRMREAFPDLHYAIDELVTARDRVTVRWTATGTHRGTLWGLVPPTGRRVSWRGIHLLTVRSGRVAEVWAASGTLEMLEQLGVELRPPPP